MAVSVTFTVNIDTAAVNRLSSPGGMVDRATARAAGKVRDVGKQIVISEGRVDTGAMAQGITSERVSSDGDGVTYVVASRQPYSKFQHDGTRTPIRPRRAKVLRFVKGGKVIFARQVRGITGIKFLTRALQQLRSGDWA